MTTTEKDKEPQGANALSDLERDHLVKCEIAIEKGLDTFVEVGLALGHISVSRLYREDYPNFAAYLEDRWRISKSHGYGLIQAAQVMDHVHTNGPGTDLNCAQAKLLAKLPPNMQLAVAPMIATATVAEAAKIINEMRTQNAELKFHDPGPIPPGKYSVILADPPWPLDLAKVEPIVTPTAAYPTMSVADIKAMAIPSAENAHCYLWVTNHTLRVGFEVLEAWGFRYITTLTWTKRPPGTGAYFRGATEHVLFGVKGKLPLQAKNIGTWFDTDELPQLGLAFEGKPAERKHSAKPDILYEIIEAASPGPYLELFQRRGRQHWIGWGNQLHNDLLEGDLVPEDDLPKGA